MGYYFFGYILTWPTYFVRFPPFSGAFRSKTVGAWLIIMSTKPTDALPTYLLLALRGLEFLAEREIRAKLKVLG